MKIALFTNVIPRRAVGTSSLESASGKTNYEILALVRILVQTVRLVATVAVQLDQLFCALFLFPKRFSLITPKKKRIAIQKI